jgi:hypothetical protein
MTHQSTYDAHSRRFASLRAAALTCLLVCAACSVQQAAASPKQTGGSCAAAMIEGVLESASKPSVLDLRARDGTMYSLVWPTGYTIDATDGGRVIDDRGAVIARAGDRVRIGGGEGDVGSWVVCAGTINVMSSGGP